MIEYLFTKTPLTFLVQSIWRDEAFSYLLAKHNIFEIISLTAKDFNPPLYYILLHFWMVIFGHSEVSLRSLSLLFYIATGYVVYLIFRDVLKIHSFRSVIYLVLFLYNPIILYYGFEARMYTMLTFFSTLSFYAYMTKKERLYAVSIIFGMYSHYFMIFTPLILSLFVLLTSKKKEYKLEIKQIILPLVAFVPWALYIVFQKYNSSGSFWILPMPWTDIFTLPSLIFSGLDRNVFLPIREELKYGLFTLFASAVIMLTIFAGYILRKNDYQKKELNYFLLFLLWAFSPAVFIFIISFVKPFYLSRYIIFTSVGLTLLLVYSIERFKLLPKILILVLLFGISWEFNKIQIKYRQKTNYAKKFSEMKNRAKPGDVVYVLDVLDFHTAEYYFDENKVYVYSTTYPNIPSYVGKSLIPQNKVAESLPMYPNRAFLVRSDASSYSIESLY